MRGLQDYEPQRIAAIPLWTWTLNPEFIEKGLGRRAPVASQRLSRKINRRRVGSRAARERPHLMHHTFTETRYLAGDRWPRTPSVLTVHDMIPERHPEFFPTGNPHQAKRDYVEQAALVLCVSASTERSMREMYGDLQCQVAITPLAADDLFTPAGDAQARRRPYVLFVGQRHGYKGFSTLLQAFARCSWLPANVDLLAVGGGEFTKTEYEQIHQLSLGDAVSHTVASNAQLARWYRGAVCLVCPSLMEGFGLPALEAMQSGCPTALSSIEALREVAQDAAQYFIPTDADDIAHTIQTLCTDTTLRRRAVAKGLERAQAFSWRECARVTADAYLSVLGTAVTE